jgi:hypothetical protein
MKPRDGTIASWQTSKIVTMRSSRPAFSMLKNFPKIFVFDGHRVIYS